MSNLDTRLKRESGVAAKVAEIIEPAIEELGLRLVRVKMTGGDNLILQIMAERPDGSMRIEDCEKISRTISPLLDVHDPVSSHHNLEVSSPGIDRPLVRGIDFERWAGFEVKIEMNSMLAGRKRFRGTLEGFSDGEARLFMPPEEKGGEDILIGLPFEQINEAHLIMSDELIAEAGKRHKQLSSTDEGAAGDGSEWMDNQKGEKNAASTK